MWRGSAAYNNHTIKGMDGMGSDGRRRCVVPATYLSSIHKQALSTLLLLFFFLFPFFINRYLFVLFNIKKGRCEYWRNMYRLVTFLTKWLVRFSSSFLHSFPSPQKIFFHYCVCHLWRAIPGGFVCVSLPTVVRKPINILWNQAAMCRRLMASTPP